MSNLPMEATEPDPAATAISNDQTVNKEAGDASAPTTTETVMAAAEPVKSNGATKVKTEEEDLDMEKNGEATPVKKENGDSPQVKKGYHSKSDHKDHKPHFKYENNSKYDPSVLPESKDPKEMRGQVEYYFGDSNLPNDKHMWEQTDGTENKPVSIKHIHSFKRMHRYQPYETLVAALKESAFLDVIGEEGEEMVKRKVAYDPAFSRSDEVKKRSIYVDGFGDEEPGSQFDIEAFFTTYGPTNRVILRRHVDRSFKGSAFVEFHDEETAEAFLKLDPKPLWKGKHELEVKSKAAFMNGKEEEIKDGTRVPKESRGPDRGYGYRGRGRGRGRDYNDRNGRGGRDYDRSRGDRDPDDWKKRREEDRASGFKDSRSNRKDNNRGHHKGGRGRRDDRGPRNNDRNREREGNKEDKAVKSEVSPAKDIKTEESTPVKNDKKRAREDDDGEQGGPVKKVDSKSEVPVEAS